MFKCIRPARIDFANTGTWTQDSMIDWVKWTNVPRCSLSISGNDLKRLAKDFWAPQSPSAHLLTDGSE